MGFASPEPLPNLVVAALAGFDVSRVAAATAALSPIALLIVRARHLLRPGARDGAADESDAWERVLLVFAVLSLSSLTMNPRPPTPPFWAGNFLLKPRHGAALGLVALAAGLLVARQPRPSLLGLVLRADGMGVPARLGLRAAGAIVGDAVSPARRAAAARAG